MPDPGHQHRLRECIECGGEGWGCSECEGHGYFRPEFCATCGEPMGNLRRAWKRAGRPAEWGRGDDWYDAYFDRWFKRWWSRVVR